MGHIYSGHGRPAWRYAIAVLVAVIGTWIGVAQARAVTVEQWNTPGGRFVNRKDEFPRDLVHGHLVTSVVLPTGYSSRRCWPVLYLLHGTADSTASVASLQWLQIENGALLRMDIPAILVIPGSGDTWWTNAWWHGLRHPAYESWILQGIVPLVAKRLNVCPGRSEHAIAGLSMGGYGAIMLAAQRPDYFGSAGSFSGVLSPESPNFVSVYKPNWATLWGPPGGFYALGHDPLALVGNLTHTRVFVGVGNGTPTAGETSSPVSVFEETEFDQEDIDFVNAARRAGASVTFDQHQGTHDPLNWLTSLTHMLAWNPFKRVVTSPARWSILTADSSGTAWGFRYTFARYHPPTQLIEFSFAKRTLTVTGGGTVSVTTPDGKTLMGKIPFRIKASSLVELSHAPRPHAVGGYRQIVPVRPKATTGSPSTTSPVTVTFTTAQSLPNGFEYQVAISAFNLTGSTSSCQDTTAQRISAPRAGQHVSVSVAPPVTASSPGHWCEGPAVAALTEVPRNAPRELGTIVGYDTSLLFR